MFGLEKSCHQFQLLYDFGNSHNGEDWYQEIDDPECSLPRKQRHNKRTSWRWQTVKFRTDLRAWYFPELNEMNIGLITWSFSLDLGGWTRTEEVISIAARLHRENWPYCELKGCCWGFPIDSCASDFQLCFVLTIQVFRLKTLF